MNILICPGSERIKEDYFPENVMKRLSSLGNVKSNPFNRPIKTEEMKELIRDVDIVVTHWSTPQFTKEVLDCAPRLKLLAHATGSVANIASDEVYERKIPVISANTIMARYVAEAALGYLICSARRLTQYDSLMRTGRFDKYLYPVTSIIGAEIGLVGLGTVGRYLLDMLRPFGVHVYVYDPYIPGNALDPWEFAELTTLEKAMSCPFVSLHASKNKDSFHVVSAEMLKLIPDGGILVNTARAAVVDMEALEKEAESGRIFAAIDVFDGEKDGCVPAGLVGAEKNSLLMPHAAALPAMWHMTDAIVDDIERFINGEPLKYEIPYAQFARMTV